MKNKRMGFFGLIGSHFSKELRMILSDSGAILILIMAMIIYPVIYSIGYVNEVSTDLSVAVVDLDRTEESQNYKIMLDGTPEMNVDYELNSLKEAEDLFMHNKIRGVVLIEKGFQENIQKGLTAHVGVYADASYFLNYRNEFMAVTFVNAYYGSKINIVNYMAEGKSLQEATVCNNPLEIQTHILYNPASGYGTFIMPGMILIILQQTLLIGIGVLGGSFSESKESPFYMKGKERVREILPYLIGKSGAYIAVSFLNIGLAVVMIHSWFDYPDKANFAHVMMLLIPYLIAIIFLGVGLSTLFKHRESAIVFMVFLSPIALFFSGLSWPVSAMPEWLAWISKVMPSTNAIPAYLRLRTMGVSIFDVKEELLFLYKQAGIYTGMTLIYFYIRVLFFEKKHKPEEGIVNT
jgi:ABC-2 type transport system permease protein